MIVVGFLFTLLIVYVVCKLISREPYRAKEKSVWKKLIYWGGSLFVSIIFNIILVSNNTYSFKLSIDLKDEGIYVFLWLVLSYLVIQFLSPSMFLGKLKEGTKSVLRKFRLIRTEHKDNASESNMLYRENSSPKKQSSSDIEFGEKDFELFLKTLCWLAFSFVIFMNLFSLMYSIEALRAYTQSEFFMNPDVQEQLTHISNIMVFFTIPICLRQIMFYLSKLKEPSAENKETSKLNAHKYERYMLIQKRLKTSNKKL